MKTIAPNRKVDLVAPPPYLGSFLWRLEIHAVITYVVPSVTVVSVNTGLFIKHSAFSYESIVNLRMHTFNNKKRNKKKNR